MSDSIGKLCKPFSRVKKINVKYKQKSVINVNEVILIFIKRRKWETMGRGYEIMGEINVDISEFGFFSVLDDLVKYEIRLSESDKIDDYDGSKKRRHILC